MTNYFDTKVPKEKEFNLSEKVGMCEKVWEHDGDPEGKRVYEEEDVKEFIKRLKDEIDVTHHKAGDMLDACLVNEEKKDVTYLLPYAELDTMIDKLAGEDLV